MYKFNKAAYLEKVRNKEAQLSKELEKRQAESGSKQPPSSSNNPQAAKPNSAAPAPSSTSASIHGTTAAAPTPAVPNNTHTPSTKDMVDGIREPLEQCRSILRILSVFGPKRDSLKEDFLKIFQRTTETLKKQKSTNPANHAELYKQTAAIEAELRSLRTKLDPKFNELKAALNVTTLAELVELDNIPFGLLERTTEINGIGRFSSRARNASMHLGGTYSLKKQKQWNE
jgi:hypothetical protein